MCQYLVVQYMKKHQKYVPISSCRLHDETSDICASIQLFSTWKNIRNMFQYLVVQFATKHQKYVLASSYKVHDETSDICASI